MKRLRHFRRRLARRWTGLTSRQRIAGCVLLTLLLIGCAWLALAARGGGAERVRLSDEPLPPARETELVARLGERGISCERREDGLYVPPEAAAAARAELAKLANREDPTEPLRRLAAGTDIWSSESQQSKRWQAAKMQTLSRLVERLPGVRAATVLFEPGSPRRLGAPAVAPKAVVNVTLDEGAGMTDTLVATIADQVAGSIHGMDRSGVRIVDSAGGTHTARRSAGADADAGLAAVREAEAHYEGKVRAALRHIEGLTVAVHVEPGGEGLRCTGASVSVPRSHLLSGTGGVGGDPADSARAESIRRSVQRLIGADSPDAVVIHTLDDGPALAAEAPTAGEPAEPDSAGAVMAGVVLAGVSGVGVILLLRRRERRCAAAEEPPEDAEPAGPAAEPIPAGAGSPFSALRHLGSGSLRAALAGEHPQTAAIVLAHVDAETAAAVLAGLDAGVQVEVTRRIAAMERVDPEAARQVAAAVARRAEQAEQDVPAGGPGAAAEILARSGVETEQAVLGGLEADAPELADELRRRIFAFEELAHVPAQVLHAALMRLDTGEVALALTAADEAVGKRALSCLPAAARRELRAAMDDLGAVRLADVEAAQWRLVQAARRAGAGRYASETRTEVWT